MALGTRRSAVRDEPIAIIGASCRFPGAEGLGSFWDLLVAGRDAVGEVDAQRWSTRFFYHPERTQPGKSYTWAAGLIDGVDRFEPSFFGISPREAVQMDPQQRVLLELVWHALEDAGIPPSRVRGTNIGVYIGASATDYSDLSLGDPAAGDSYFMTGNALSILANRISYVFDVRGPSLAVDTACSSSLVALHQACEAIHSGQIASAIVGGVNLLLTPYPFLGFCRASMLSRRGRCFAFDERADGYVRGEGGAVVIVKPLADALADRDPIRALILATGCNSDGRTIGLSLPSAAAQEALLASVYRNCGVAAEALAFFEMHGTGTPAGDPVEAAAVGRALGSTRQEPLPIGSVKTNIGHLEAASGLAGLLKAVLALEHGVVPPTLHCETPNPNIDFAGLNLRLVRAAEPIGFAKQLIAGVNSFGFGGTNAHAVLASAPQRPRPAGALPMPLLVISAAAEASLRALVGSWRGLIAKAEKEQLPQSLRAAARGRDHHRHRLATLRGDRSTVARSLDQFLANEPTSELVTGTAVAGARLAFVFGGNGAQFPGMGQAALRANPAFRNAVEEVDEILRPELGWSVAERIEGGVDAIGVARADIAQPVLFAIQVGIVGALRVAGITAEGYFGHSVGEIAAAWAAGALSLTDAARVIVARSRTQQSTAGRGRMAALGLGYEAAAELLAELGSGAEIAASNAARSVTVSGPAHEIGHLAAAARDRGISCRPLDLDFAFHSRLMDPVRGELLADLIGLSPKHPISRLASTVTGGFVENELLGAEHWWRNIRDPVRFSEAMAALIGDGFNIFVEIGPSPILRSYLTDALGSAAVEGRVLASLTRNDDEADPFPAIAAQCWVAGCDWLSSPIFDGEADARGLPLYQWDRQRFWLDKTVEAADLIDPPLDHPLLGFRQRGHYPCWVNHLDPQVLPWIADHAVDGLVVFPAAAIIEMALAAAHWRWPDARVLEAAEVEIRHLLPFEKRRMRELRMALTSEDGDWELVSRPRLASEPMTPHAVGRIAASHHALGHMPSTEPAATHSVDRDTLYRIAARMGLDYGSRFCTIDRVEVLAPDRAIVHLDPTNIGEPLEAYFLHPALLDGAMQGLLAIAGRETGEGEGSFLPWRFGRVRLEAPFGRVCRRAELRLTRIGARSASADFLLYDAVGNPIAELVDCWFRRVALGRNGSAAERMFRVDMVPAPLVAAEPPEALAEAGVVLTRLIAAKASDPERCEQSTLLEAMIGTAAFRLWRALVTPKQPFTLRDLIQRGRISPTATGLAECLLRSIERLGGAREDRGEWRIEVETDLPEAAEIWRLLLADAPDLVGELALVGEALDRLPDILTAGPARSEPAPPTMVEHFLDASPASAAGSDLLGEALSVIAARWPSDRPLRILEIGAEPNVTRRLLNRLAKSPAAIAYVATSPDAEQFDRLSAMTKSFAGASACHWIPGTAADPIGDKRFDIVLAANTCARLQLDAAVLAGLRDLLVPGGLFVAVEPEPNTVWDVVFGQDAAWWLQDRSRAPISPLRSRDEWQAELTDAGFRNAAAASLSDGPWPVAAFWGNASAGREPVAIEPAPRPAIAVIAEDTPLSRALVDRLEADGHSVTVTESSDLSAASRHIAGHENGSRTVIFIAAEPEATSGVAAQIAALVRIANATVEYGARLFIVTTNAQQAIPGGRQTGLAGSAIWGFARVLANELPRLSLRMIDLAGTESAKSHAGQIAEEIAAATLETEIVRTPRGRHVMRLRSGLPPLFGSRGEARTLTAAPTGGLHSLGWVSRATRPPGTGEIEIEVHAAGLNFRDVMWAIGLLPEEALIDGFAGPTFGLECAGVVRAIGAGVGGLTIGDRVMALAPAALGTRVVTSADAAVPLPPSLGFVAAATLPVAFITVIYALGHLAQLEPGEHVLVHAAAGGVGLAAIQYAKHRGAVVIATAGSPMKRTFLRLAGADHVLASRDLDFADQVREITGGAGVDVVLNSLSGEAMERSLELLRPFGRFLELGKRDFYLNRRLHLRPLRHNVSYFAIDVDQLPLRRPALARSLHAEVSTLLRDGVIRPLAHRTFRYSEFEEAFRLMQASGHIGKLVLVPDRDDVVPVRASTDFAARADATYLVTGGIEGFGFEAARWLVGQGARAIALLGRRGLETPGCEARIAELTAAGADVRVYRGDVADQASLAAVLTEIRASRPPLCGIVHAAAIIDDRLATEIDPAGADRVLRPKLAGAIALDELTRDDPIELFLLFSSATTLLGAPGQGAYVAANLALEALARRRHAEGRPALAVGWGPIEDAGYLAQRPEMREALARRLGAVPIPASQALAALPAMLASGLPVVSFADANWGEARRILPALGTPLFSEIRHDHEGSATDDLLAERLQSLDPDAAQRLLQQVVAEEAGRILRLPSDNVNRMRPLSELGMDSLMAVELRLALEARLGVDLPLVSLAEGTSIASIAVRLGSGLAARAEGAEIETLAARHEVFDETMSAMAPTVVAPKTAAE